MAWASLVITAGPAAADALDSWSSAPRAVASIMLWAAWGAGLLASFAPRPLGLTVLRVTAPVALAPGAGRRRRPRPPRRALLAVAGTAVAAGLAFTPDVGYRFVNGAAYGEERRFPLRVPPALLLGPVPLAGGLLVAAAVPARSSWPTSAGCPGSWPWSWRCRSCGRPAGPSMPCRNVGRCWSPPGSSSRTR